MPTTTNFGWTTPADTDYVKDGALAIRTLGNGIDTSLVDLKGGTSGQVLAKNSNTDMDFVWVAQDDSNAIQNAIVDAKGDLIAASAADTPARLAVGTNNTRLVAASAETTGLKWVADTQNTVIDAEGDLLVGDSADALQRLAIGTTGQVLTVDTAVDGKIKWASVSSTPSFVGVSAFKTAAQSLANNTGVLVSFNDENFDTDGFHSTTLDTTRFTIPSGKAGKYLLVARVVFDANATGVRAAYWKKNGTTIAQPAQWSAGSAGATRMCITSILSLAEGDYIELEAYQNSGGALDISGTTEFTNMQMQFLGA